MSHIGIVTDSTCDMGPDRLKALGVAMVPLHVRIGGETFRDWVDLDAAAFYARMASCPDLPTTSQPSPAEFSAVYDRLAAEGATAIVSIHLTSELSGTVGSAELAARSASVPVHVVDTRLVSWAAALVVQAACAARDAGGDAAAIVAAAEHAAAHSEVFFVLDTLDNLVKGGRAGRAQGLAASLLNIKAVLTISNGVVEPYAKARGARAAYRLLALHVAERSREVGGIKAVVIHAVAPELAELMQQELQAAGMVGEVIAIGDIGAVIGTYAAAHAVGVCFVPVA